MVMSPQPYWRSTQATPPPNSTTCSQPVARWMSAIVTSTPAGTSSRTPRPPNGSVAMTVSRATAWPARPQARSGIADAGTVEPSRIQHIVLVVVQARVIDVVRPLEVEQVQVAGPGAAALPDEFVGLLGRQHVGLLLQEGTGRRGDVSVADACRNGAVGPVLLGSAGHVELGHRVMVGLLLGQVLLHVGPESQVAGVGLGAGPLLVGQVRRVAPDVVGLPGRCAGGARLGVVVDLAGLAAGVAVPGHPDRLDRGVLRAVRVIHAAEAWLLSLLGGMLGPAGTGSTTGVGVVR